MSRELTIGFGYRKISIVVFRLRLCVFYYKCKKTVVL